MVAHNIVLLSGGIDSAVCLQIALRRMSEVRGVYFDYGQQSSIYEKEASLNQARNNDIHLNIVDYEHVFGDFKEGLMDDKWYTNEDEEGEHSSGYVPQRNLHFLTTACAIGEHMAIPNTNIILYYGAQAGDNEDYPDCRQGFIIAAIKALNKGTDEHNISIEAPLIDMEKYEVIEKGEELGVNWNDTVSCYNIERGLACGECPACVERREAFNIAGVEDPQEYK